MKKYLLIFFIILIQSTTLSNLNFLYAQAEKPYKLKPVGDEAYQAILQFYQYDKDIPLEAHIVEKLEKEDYIREKIVIRGTRDSRVPGYLAIPKKGTPPYPCILQIHGLTLSKSDWWEYSYAHGELVTKELLSSGFAVLSLDMQYHGERSIYNDFESTYNMLFEKRWGYRFRDMIVQTTIEYRRAMDYLTTRSEIDTSQFGVIGSSIGGVMTFILTGIDSRIKVSVACVTPTMKPRPFLPPEKYISGFAAHTFVRSIRERPFLMLMGNQDKFNYTVEEAKQLYDLIESKHKNIIFYDSGHKMPENYVGKAVEWFKNYLQ